jgi:transcriptional regulator with XRE-family HTH domain
MAMEISESDEVSAAQVRAARALLAWSQKDLATRASVGSSTVADFERGQRTPVANNIAAIRKALEDAGIGFRSGGAVVGGAPAALAASTTQGSPIRWIDSTDLSNWANRRSCQDTMPELVSRLIRASMGPAARLRFPSGDSIQQPDWDGVCEIGAAISDPYIPSGTSGWEIGTQRDKIKDKANSDYEKRSADPVGLQSAQSTFMFVTPRRWTKKREWVSERKKDGKWAEVRALDADDLVHWIELFPAVGAWLATILGKRPAGVRQIDEVWREWSCSTRRPLSEDLMLAGRDEQSAAVLRWLYSRASVLAVQADSPVESAAFLYATLSQLPSEFRDYYFSMTLLAATPDVARALSDSTSPLVIVIEDADPGLSTLLSQRGHHVYLIAANADGQSATGINLPRPLRENVRQSLQDMGIKEDLAERLARDSGRSLAVLRRLIPAAPGTIVPKWAESPHARAIIPALFVGGWDESNEGDRKSLEQLSGEPYEKWISSITPWTS